MVRGKRYKITWVDIDHSNEWCTIEEIKKSVKEIKPMEMIWIFVMQTKNYYVFSSGYNESTQQYWDRVIIPKGAVKKIQPLNE